jgi:hypothetical protein
VDGGSGRWKWMVEVDGGSGRWWDPVILNGKVHVFELSMKFHNFDNEKMKLMEDGTWIFALTNFEKTELQFEKKEFANSLTFE